MAIAASVYSKPPTSLIQKLLGGGGNAIKKQAPKVSTQYVRAKATRVAQEAQPNRLWQHIKGLALSGLGVFSVITAPMAAMHLQAKHVVAHATEPVADCVGIVAEKGGSTFKVVEGACSGTMKPLATVALPAERRSDAFVSQRGALKAALQQQGLSRAEQNQALGTFDNAAKTHEDSINAAQSTLAQNRNTMDKLGVTEPIKQAKAWGQQAIDYLANQGVLRAPTIGQQ